ncbi:MAG: (Fe-S)-binding protein [Clostridia bacterium]
MNCSYCDVTGMGLIAAVILTVASKLMYVPVDERVAAIREVLPGANCGACGFAGCDDYAAAFTDNPGLSCSLCPVGGASVASQIAGIMGEEASAAEPQVAMVMCQGSFRKSSLQRYRRLTSCKEGEDALRTVGMPFRLPGTWRLLQCLQVRCNNCRQRCSKCSTELCAWDAELVNVCPNGIISVVPAKNLVFVACKSMEKGAETRKACTAGCMAVNAQDM